MVAIVGRSMAVVTFASLLALSLSNSQRQHVERMIDLILDCTACCKTLAQLVLLKLDGIYTSNLADFFRISPWDPDERAATHVRIHPSLSRGTHCRSDVAHLPDH